MAAKRVQPITTGFMPAPTAPVSVVFVDRENGPEKLVSEVELHFHEACGPLAGLKLVGFTIC